MIDLPGHGPCGGAACPSPALTSLRRCDRQRRVETVQEVYSWILGQLETAGWTTHHWLHFLRQLAGLRVWWAATDAPEEYEDALLDAFAAGVNARSSTSSTLCTK